VRDKLLQHAILTERGSVQTGKRGGKGIGTKRMGVRELFIKDQQINNFRQQRMLFFSRSFIYMTLLIARVSMRRIVFTDAIPS